MINLLSKFSKVIIFLFVINLVLACAVRTPVKQVSIDSLRNNLKYENIIFKNIDIAPNVVDYKDATRICKNAAVSHLKSKNVFKRVEDVSETSYEEPSLIIEATIIDLRVVSTAARIWAGELAGRSHIKLLVKLTDVSTDEVIAQKELFGAPNASGSTWSFGASDRNLSRNMGILLGDFILANVSK